MLFESDSQVKFEVNMKEKIDRVNIPLVKTKRMISAILR